MLQGNGGFAISPSVNHGAHRAGWAQRFTDGVTANPHFPTARGFRNEVGIVRLQRAHTIGKSVFENLIMGVREGPWS